MPAIRLYSPDDDDSAPTTPPGVSAPITGGAVIRRYLDDLAYRLQIGQVTSEHVANTRRSLEAAKKYADGSSRYVGFIEVVGDRLVADLIQHDLTEWLRKNPQWKSPETRRNNLKAVLACFTWADDEGVLRPCPYRKTKKFKEPRVKRRDAKDDEAEKLWGVASLAMRRALWLIDATGARCCEARVLKWDEILWSQGVAVLGKHKQTNRQTEPEPRIVGLEDVVLAELHAWHGTRKPDQATVLLSERGRVWTKDNLCNQFAKLREKCGLPKDLKMYGFRHRFLTLAIRAGMTDREAADLAGHSGTASIRQYTHTNDIEQIKEKSDKFAAARAAMDVGKRIKTTDQPASLFDGLES